MEVQFGQIRQLFSPFCKLEGTWMTGTENTGIKAKKIKTTLVSQSYDNVFIVITCLFMDSFG
jgi:hypothetical protein